MYRRSDQLWEELASGITLAPSQDDTTRTFLPHGSSGLRKLCFDSNLRTGLRYLFAWNSGAAASHLRVAVRRLRIQVKFLSSKDLLLSFRSNIWKTCGKSCSKGKLRTINHLDRHNRDDGQTGDWRKAIAQPLLLLRCRCILVPSLGSAGSILVASPTSALKGKQLFLLADLLKQWFTTSSWTILFCEHDY